MKYNRNDISLQLCDTQSRFDIVLISPNTTSSGTFHTNLLIAPESINIRALEASDFKNVISYGLCRKNTITMSSLSEKRLTVAVQRKIPICSSRTIDEQEISRLLIPDLSIEENLGIIATLIAIGVLPAEHF